ncbi:hypothetical protein [Magnetospira sp. QH-2]|uniref:hypothetical protein n=1 Tax=Magnetospira sp. (strain QH-2) TaxID=1288970 RepID=UPI0003E81B93|nr:hypothetical protein [Magnetospira sp. QH-2]CCQ72380.1 protein of unknown function [Magnetospira sp. QH-2]
MEAERADQARKEAEAREKAEQAALAQARAANTAKFGTQGPVRQPTLKESIDPLGLGGWRPGDPIDKGLEGPKPSPSYSPDTGAPRNTPALENKPPTKQPQKTAPARSDLSITDRERAMAKAGNALGFWSSRKAKGDPVADIALASLNPPGGLKDALFGGKQVNDRLEAFSRAYAGKSVDQDKVRQDLMEAHIEAVEEDDRGVLGLLDPEQIYDYHKGVFSKHGLPSTTFGGTPLTGSRWEANLWSGLWCSDCDD